MIKGLAPRFVIKAELSGVESFVPFLSEAPSYPIESCVSLIVPSLLGGKLNPPRQKPIFAPHLKT